MHKLAISTIVLAPLLVISHLAMAQETLSLSRLSTVYRLPAPPDGFDPVHATDSDLARFGLPPRPSKIGQNGFSYATWLRIMSAARHYVAPQIRFDDRQHGLPQSLVRTDATVAYSTNWAGEALQNSSTSYGANSYTELVAQWVVSSAVQPINTCGGTDLSATWVGIDGLSGTRDVLQAGTEADAECSRGVTVPNYYAWFEWYPAYGYTVTNFPITAGSSVFVSLQATSATNGIATFVNLQTGAYTTVGVTAPSGTYLHGNSAEWIIERPSPNGSTTPGTLADFGMIQMGSEVAFLVDQINTGNFEVPGAPGSGQTGSTLTMVDNSNNPLAVVTVESISAQMVQVAGAAK